MDLDELIYRKSFIKRMESYWVFAGKTLLIGLINVFDFDKEVSPFPKEEIRYVMRGVEDGLKEEKLERIIIYKRKFFKKPTF